MSKRDYIKKAKKLEYDADIVFRTQCKVGAYSTAPIELLEKAARYRMKAGDFEGAESVLRNAYTDAHQLNRKKSGTISKNKISRIEENIGRMDKLNKGKWRIRKKRILETSLAVIGIFGGIFFLSPILTGNAISDLTNQTSNIIGGVLFVIGIIGSYFWFKKR